MNHGKALKGTGFTLVEVLAAAALATVAVTACLTAMAQLERSEAKARARENLINLTVEKYDEVVATYDLSQSNSLNGDFTDRNDNDHTWVANVQSITSSGTNSNTVVNTASTASTDSTTVDQLSVTVSSNSNPNAKYTVTGLVYVPATTTTGATGGAAPRAGTGGRAG